MSETSEDAIQQVAASLDVAVTRFTDAVVRGTKSKQEARALNKLIVQFLELRAAVTGDMTWLEERQRQKDENSRRFAELIGVASDTSRSLREAFGPPEGADR